MTGSRESYIRKVQAARNGNTEANNCAGNAMNIVTEATGSDYTPPTFAMQMAMTVIVAFPIMAATLFPEVFHKGNADGIHQGMTGGIEGYALKGYVLQFKGMRL